jgi:hypothetical protein
MIRAVSKAHQHAKKLEENLTSQCGKLEQASLRRRKNEPTVRFAPPPCVTRVQEQSVPYGPAAEMRPVRQRVWWNPLTWKNQP